MSAIKKKDQEIYCEVSPINHAPISKKNLDHLRSRQPVRTEMCVFHSEEEVVERLAITDADCMLVLNDEKPLGSVAELIQQVIASGQPVPVLFLYFN